MTALVGPKFHQPFLRRAAERFNPEPPQMTRIRFKKRCQLPGAVVGGVGEFGALRASVEASPGQERAHTINTGRASQFFQESKNIFWDEAEAERRRCGVFVEMRTNEFTSPAGAG